MGQRAPASGSGSDHGWEDVQRLIPSAFFSLTALSEPSDTTVDDWCYALSAWIDATPAWN